MKTDMIYSDDTLFIYLEGKANKKNMKILRNKMVNIINEYQINDIVIDAKNIRKNNDLYLDDFVDDYRFRFDGDIVIRK